MLFDNSNFAADHDSFHEDNVMPRDWHILCVAPEGPFRQYVPDPLFRPIDNTKTLNHVDYSGYGQVTAQTNSSHSDRYLYTSREYEAEIELQYNSTTYLDLRTGAWIAEDPIGFSAGDSNLQRYVENSFPNATDPSGLVTESEVVESEKIQINKSDYVQIFVKTGIKGKQKDSNDVELTDGIQIQVVSNSKEPLKKIDLLRFTKRTFVSKDDSKPIIPVPTIKRDIKGEVFVKGYYVLANDKKWNADSLTMYSAYYDIHGSYSSEKFQGRLHQLSIFDEPGLLMTNGAKGKSEYIEAVVAIVFDNKRLLAQTYWKREAKNVEATIKIAVRYATSPINTIKNNKNAFVKDNYKHYLWANEYDKIKKEWKYVYISNPVRLGEE